MVILCDSVGFSHIALRSLRCSKAVTGISFRCGLGVAVCGSSSIEGSARKKRYLRTLCR